jgi:hypothetical protein
LTIRTDVNSSILSSDHSPNLISVSGRTDSSEKIDEGVQFEELDGLPRDLSLKSRKALTFTGGVGYSTLGSIVVADVVHMLDVTDGLVMAINSIVSGRHNCRV